MANFPKPIHSRCQSISTHYASSAALSIFTLPRSLAGSNFLSVDLWSRLSIQCDLVGWDYEESRVGGRIARRPSGRGAEPGVIPGGDLPSALSLAMWLPFRGSSVLLQCGGDDSAGHPRTLVKRCAKCPDCWARGSCGACPPPAQETYLIRAANHPRNRFAPNIP